jgi:Golgi phosphoprotein 3 (GPP34)
MPRFASLSGMAHQTAEGRQAGSCTRFPGGAATMVLMDTGTDLLLLAIDPDSGQTRFGPRLSYALPVAELTDLVRAGRLGLDENNLVVINAKPTGETQADSALAVLAANSGPVSVTSWVKWRGPRRIDPYLHAAVDAGIVHIVTAGSPGRKLISVDDAEPIKSATRKLMAVLDEPEASFADIAFAVLAGTAGLAGPHLHGWDRRRHRARLSALDHAGPGDVATSVLHAGAKAARRLARRAGLDPRTIDQQIGLTPAGRDAAIFLGGQV